MSTNKDPSKPDDGGPAFPATEAHGTNSGVPGMTLRQYAAIKLRVPTSGTDWLDDMIRKSLLNEHASKAMQGYLASCPPDFEPAEFATRIAEDSYALAAAMIKVGRMTP